MYIKIVELYKLNSFTHTNQNIFINKVEVNFKKWTFLKCPKMKNLDGLFLKTSKIVILNQNAVNAKIFIPKRAA